MSHTGTVVAQILETQNHFLREQPELITREITAKLPMPRMWLDTLKLLGPTMTEQELPRLGGMVFGL